MEATVHVVMCLFFLLLYLFSVQMLKVIKKMLLKYTSIYALLLVILEYVVLIYTGTHLNHFNGGFHDNSSKLVPECQTVLDFTAARDNGSGCGDSQNSWMCKARFRSPPPTYQHQHLGQMFFLLPKLQSQSTEGMCGPVAE